MATVAANEPICLEHYRLLLQVKNFPPTRPGQFVQVACRDLNQDYSPATEFDWQPGQTLDLAGRELMSPLAFLRRPFSIGGRRDDGEMAEIELIYRIVGVGTNWLAKVKRGQTLRLIGPLGNHFEPPPKDGIAILVGGGVGIPPMMYLASELAGRKAVAFCGAVRRDLLALSITADAPQPKADSIEPLYNVAEFARHGVPAVICTDDGSYGFHGLVTQPLERYLDTYIGGEGPGVGGQEVVIYTCGPEPMMKRVAQIGSSRGIPVQVSVERAMACGMGTCQSCVTRVKNPAGGQEKPWVYKLACTDGPVFNGDDLLW